MLDCDQYLLPRSLTEAFDAMERFDGQYRLIAGATDLIPYAREARGGDMHFPVLIDLTGLPELKGVQKVGSRIRMGALTTFADFMRDPLLLEQAPVLNHCAAWVADDQIRAVATIGGNIVNASPAADGTVALLVLNATVTLESRRGGVRRTRTLSIPEFVLGPGLTALDAGEILTGLECDAVGPAYGSAFEKVGRRRSLVIAVASSAGLVKLTEDRSAFADVRLALGAVSPVPIRVPEIEQALVGQPVRAEVIRRAAEMAAEKVASRTRKEYRREVVVNFIERALLDSLKELGLELEVAVRG